MEYLHYHERPLLRRPILIAAFEGWGDASEVATWTARFLVRRWSAAKFAEIDGEEFYVFTENRPYTRWVSERQRAIFWPSNDFYYHVAPDGEQDFIVLVGPEPQLKWKTFVSNVLQVVQEMDVSLVLSLGGVLAAVPHTQPVRLTGTALDLDLKRLPETPHSPSRYEGPTGIMSVLNSSLEASNVPIASLWGSVPHYLAARPNLKVSLAMVKQLQKLFNVSFDLSRMEERTARFEEQVSQVVRDNAELMSYVQKLEEEMGRTGADEPAAASSSTDTEELPSGEALVKDLEEFLKRRREEGNRGPRDAQ